MGLISLEGINQLHDLQRPLFGLDRGDKTIGIAISDPNWTLATPLTTLHRLKFKKDARALIDLMEERGIIALIIGHPLNMDGSEGPRVQMTRQFITNFLFMHDMPIALWDERLSTVAVDRSMSEMGLSNKKKDKVVDKLAASFILQGALDFLSMKRNPVD